MDSIINIIFFSTSASAQEQDESLGDWEQNGKPGQGYCTIA